MSAFGSVDNAIRSVQMRRDVDADADSFPPGGELAVYVWACAPYRDDQALDMAGKVHSLVSGMFSVGDSLDLPEEPSLFLQISRGDEAEAKRLQQQFDNAVSGGSDLGAGEAAPLPGAPIAEDKKE